MITAAYFLYKKARQEFLPELFIRFLLPRYLPQLRFWARG